MPPRGLKKCKAGEILIGRGKSARVYKIDGSPHPLVRKEFSPIYPVKLWNWFFYHSPHPLTTEAGHTYAYWKRRLAHRLCGYLDTNVHIADALRPSQNGFISRFIDANMPKRKDKKKLFSAVRKLEDFFGYIGMPTWSFSRKNPFARSNFMVDGDLIHIVDYEQSVPVRDARGHINYDTIYFDEVHNFITEKHGKFLDMFGAEGICHLKEALQMVSQYHHLLDLRPKKTKRIADRKK